MSRHLAVSLLSGLLILAAGSPGGKQQAARFLESGVPTVRPASGPPDRADLIRAQHLPNVELITHEGRRVRFYDDLVKGKVVAINFMYATCRGFCLPATANLAKVQKSLQRRYGMTVTFLSLSLDSEKDTPEVLNEYARRHGAGPGWYFLTGKRENIELLRRRLGAYELDPAVDADITQHAGIVILGNEPKGRWKAISALSKPVRIRQAVERTILPPSRWPSGTPVVEEVPREKSAASQRLVEPLDLARLRIASR